MFYGIQMVFNYPMVLPKVPATLKIPQSYPYLWAKMAKIFLKQVFDDTCHQNVSFYIQIFPMGQQLVFKFVTKCT
jgi:hypothetical protein